MAMSGHVVAYILDHKVRHLFLGLILIFCIRLALKTLRDPLRDIPGPWPARYTRLWLWKQYRGGQFHDKNIQLHQQFGPIVRIAPNEFSIDDPEALYTIYGHGTKFVKSRWYLASGPPTQHEGVVVSVFSDRNPKRHGETRRKVANAYAMSSILKAEPYIASTVRIFMGHLDKFATTNQSFDIGTWLQYYAFDVIGEITFAERFGFLDQGKDIDNIMENLEIGLRKFAPLGVWHELHYPYRKLQSFIQRFLRPMGRGAVATFTRSRIQERILSEKTATTHRDFLTRFMDLHQASPQNFTLQEVFQICLTQITAGSDTTAISLRAVLYYLYQDPTRLAILRKEIEDKTNSGEASQPITYKETLNLPYLQAVIKEALRLHPATGLPLSREVPQGGAHICGRLFPEGNVVGINAWVAHANRSVFGEEAHEFRPERWLVDTSTSARLDRYFVAFGLGSRTCLGKNLALMEVLKLVPEIVRNFEITFEQKWQVENIWFVKQTGLICRARRI